jgi:beta-phosphoglucomutase-like phosphatase (HAD superfamily)
MSGQEHPRVEGVIFDMDGLMFDTERLAVEGWQIAGAEFGIPIPDDLVIDTAGRNAADTRAVLEEGLERKIPFAQMRERRLAYAWECMDRDGVPGKRGLLSLLDLLDNRRLPRAVATSTDRDRTERILEMSGLTNRFPVLVCGDEIARGKPEPDIFLAAARAMGVDPAHCVVLEDSESGIRAAHAAGMIPMLVPDLKALPAEVEALASGVFDSLEEVAAYLSGTAS